MVSHHEFVAASGLVVRRLAVQSILVILLTASAVDLLHAQAEGWWRHLSVLADDSLLGRQTGSRGERAAGDYVVSQFVRAGLEPGANGGWFQPVRLVARIIDESHSHLALVRGDGSTDKVEFGRDASVSVRLSRGGRINAPLVFVGYGLVVPEAKWDDLAGVDLRGKIAVVITGGPPTIPGPVLAHYQAERWEPLRRAGAVGVITIQQPRAMDIPWDRAVTTRLIPAMSLAEVPVGDSDALITLNFNPAQADRLLAGSGHSIAELLAIAESGKAHPRFDLPSRLRADVTITSQEVKSRNIIGLRRGIDPLLAGEYVVVSAHSDHLGVGPVLNGDSIYNGAMDDASGVATVLETALAQRAHGYRPRRTILFVIFTAEEKGLLGSAWFVRHPTVPRSAIAANINVDFAPPLFPLEAVRAIGDGESDLGKDVGTVAALHGLPVRPDAEPLRNAFRRGDHYSFAREGIPAILLTVGFARDSLQAVTRWRAERYHSPTDDLDQPLNMQTAEKFNRIFAEVVRVVADRPTRPRWNADSFFRRFAPP